MPKQSGFLQRQQQIQNNVMRAAETLAKQYMLDTLQIAANRAFGFGYDRQSALLDVWESVRREYKAALDRALREIVKDHQPFFPFQERYPELKKIKYGR